MSNCISSPTTFAHNCGLLLEAQTVATTASLAGNLAPVQESVPVLITPESTEWTFTVACVMSRADVEYQGDPEKPVIDLLMSGVSVDRLLWAVELVVKTARAEIARFMAKQA